MEQQTQQEKTEEKPKKIPTRKIKFMNNEDPEVNLEFTYIRKGDGAPLNFNLWPGYEYDLPEDVINHLNSLEYPTYNMEQDPVTGQIYHKRAGSMNRFTCHPVG